LTVRIAWTDHLVALVGRTEAAAARLAAAPAAARAALAADARRAAARLSVRMDASPLEEATADAVDARLAAGLPPVAAAPAQVPATGPAAAGAVGAVGADPSGGWGRALRLEGMATQDVAAVEYADLLTALAHEDEAAALLEDRPLEALALLHRHVVHGLVAEDVAARPRRTDQAVHDGAEGRVLYRAADPAAVPALLDGLARWLTGRAGLLPGAVVAGVVHERVLEWQPYEAGNGRVARAASRAVLRARGLDPDGVAVPERVWATDLAGYHREVAATTRRGDLSGWLERALEGTAAALEEAADAAAGQAPPAPPPHAAAALAGLAPTFTLREYADLAGTTLAAAAADLAALARAGLATPEPGSSGLRHRRT